jgi:hypothetical protein
LSIALLTGMTGISLHVQWPLTSQSHGSILKERKEKINILKLISAAVKVSTAMHDKLIKERK